MNFLKKLNLSLIKFKIEYYCQDTEGKLLATHVKEIDLEKKQIMLKFLINQFRDQSQQEETHKGLAKYLFYFFL